MVKVYTDENMHFDISDLLEIMHILRSPGGCPWDIVQTHKSIRNDLLEEAYEAADAVDTEDSAALCEELGDMLLQVVFHSEIAASDNEFSFDEVVNGICKKLVYRHPHVFGEVKADTPEKVLDNWDKLKKAEKGQETYTDTLKAVPKAFPALMRAAKVQKRASKAGFDWKYTEEAFKKLPEELNELEEAVSEGNSDAVFEEFGDLLFAAVNVARFLKINPEEALAKATDKFTSRFEKVEREVIKQGSDMKELSLDELDEIWDKVKHT